MTTPAARAPRASLTRYLPPAALLALGFGLQALAIPFSTGAPVVAAVLFGAGAVAGIAAESWLVRLPVLFEALERFQVGHTVRSGLRGLLLLGLAAPWAGTDRGLFVVVAVALAVVWVSRTAQVVVQADTETRRLLPVSWRNFEVPGVRQHPPLAPTLLGHAGHWNSVAGNVLVAGVVARLAGAPRGLAEGAAVVAAALALVLLGLAVVDALRARADTPAEEVVDLLAAALRERAPEVLFYYSRPEPIGYIANVWMPTLEAVGRNTVVLVRERHNAPLVETDRLPVVQVTRATDIERVVPESVRIALYPSNVAKNNHLLRLPGIVDVFVGHGDSDKGGSATVLTRIFDEAWVSGPAARDRYRVADVGVRDEQIREIGRPQLAEIERVAAPLAENHHGGSGSATWEYTVLYAPTREGFFAEWEYSSVLTQGDGILRSLLGMPGVRVLFKPHPGTGTDDPAFGAEVERLKAMVEAAGSPHEVVTGAEGLYSAFNRADLLVSDISSVITDFLASGKPYVVTSSSSEDPERFRQTFPSAAGAYVLTGDGSAVGACIEDARTVDTFAAERARTAQYLLGDYESDMVARFDRAIDEAVETAAARAAQRIA
jgi:hypothetical protein